MHVLPGYRISSLWQVKKAFDKEPIITYQKLSPLMGITSRNQYQKIPDTIAVCPTIAWPASHLRQFGISGSPVVQQREFALMAYQWFPLFWHYLQFSLNFLDSANGKLNIYTSGVFHNRNHNRIIPSEHTTHAAAIGAKRYSNTYPSRPVKYRLSTVSIQKDLTKLSSSLLSIYTLTTLQQRNDINWQIIKSVLLYTFFLLWLKMTCTYPNVDPYLTKLLNSRGDKLKCHIATLVGSNIHFCNYNITINKYTNVLFSIII